MRQFFPILILSCVYSITYSTVSFAEEVSADPATVSSDEPIQSIGTVWTSSAELGLVATSGNTDNQSINFGFNVARETDKWKQSVQAKVLRAEDQGAKTAENLLLELQVDRKLTQYDYLFSDLSYEQDKFKGFDNQMTASVGYGRKILDSDKLKLRGETGIGMRHRELTTGEKTNEGILGLTGVLDWQISESASFQEDLSTLIGSDLTTIRSISSITVTIKDNLALKFSFEIKNSSDVPVGIEKTDTLTTASLVLNF